jgi:putative FmdB family regulatory protein
MARPRRRHVPTYCYKADAPDDCPMCADGFETVQTLSDPALAACPTCEKPIHRIISIGTMAQCVPNQRWNTKKLLSDGNLKKNGFKKLMKDGSGKYVDVLQDK